jgi:hypothetical protein
MQLKRIVFPLLLLPLVAFAKPTVTEEINIVRSPNIKVYAFEKVMNRWSSEQWVYFDDLIKRESGWKTTGAHYPSGYTKGGVKSSAWGLCGTMVNTHKDLVEDFKTNPYAQIDWCIDYVSARYKSPQKAIQFHNKNNWF